MEFLTPSKFYIPSNIKYSNKSITYLFLIRLGCHGSTENLYNLTDQKAQKYLPVFPKSFMKEWALNFEKKKMLEPKTPL